MLRPGKGYDNGLPSRGGGGGGDGYYSGGGYNSGGSTSAPYGGYTGPSNDTGYASSRPQHSRRSKDEPPLMKYIRDKWTWAILVCFLFFCTTLHYRTKYNSTLTKLKVKSIDEAVQKMANAERDKARWKMDPHMKLTPQDEYKKKLAKLEEENQKLGKEMDDLRKEKDDLRIKVEKSLDSQAAQKQQGLDPQTMEKQATREKAMMRQIALLQNATQRESKRVAIDRFGLGPHRVKLSLKLPGDEEGIEHYIVIEMAPLDLMPHAVHLFLEQVTHHLWDNTNIYLNGPHIMQAGPQDYMGDSEGSALQPFLDTKLDKLTFPEYNPEYPHLPFTLGFTGRPGGPDFYINKGNNTILHGPGGQSQHGMQEQADSCFAKVVEGQEVVRTIHELPTYKPGEDFAYFLKQPVQIVSARIIEAPMEAETKRLDDAMRKAYVTAETLVGAAPRKPINPRTVEEQ